MSNKTIKNLETSGLISDSDGRFDLFIPEQSGIYVPPDVIIEGVILHFPPVPDNLHAYNHRNHLLYWLQQNGWKKPINVNTKKMFNDFLNLSGEHPYFPDTIEKIRKFALKYGPLWESSYRPQGKKPAWYKSGNWYGYEIALRWHEKAKEIEAVFEVAICLLENKKAPKEKWLHLNTEDAFEYDIEIQRQLLSGIINANLKRFISLQTMWEKGGFKVHIDTGLGFLGTLWLHISQILTKNLMLCTCDGCGRPYLRTGRKPQKGRRNFCESCGQGDKASKRLWRPKNKGGDK